MTTTLRPTGGERLLEDGTRSRAYDIRVNNRNVGSLLLRTQAEPGGTAAVPAPVGRLERLTVDPGERRRGRGTVAVLAAEEVLRGWGCTRVWVAVPGTAQEALGLATALGYREASRHMSKVLRADPRPLPVGSHGRPLAESEMSEFIERTHEAFVSGCVAQGLDEGHAATLSRASFAEHLPQGAATPHAALRLLLHEREPVGTLWVSLANPEAEGAFVYAVQVDQAHRGRGHGRTLMLLAEREALQAGAPTLGLNVFAANTPARNLYNSLGYETDLVHFNKPLL